MVLMNNDFRIGFEKIAATVMVRGGSVLPEHVRSQLESNLDQDIHARKGRYDKFLGTILGGGLGVPAFGSLTRNLSERGHALGMLGGALVGGGLGHYIAKKRHEKSPVKHNEYYYQ